MGKKAADLTGMRYERWTALYRINTTKPAMWMCQCECGIQRPVWDADLKRGSSKSCGCLRDEFRIENLTTHGGTGTKEYRTWLHIIQRCENRNINTYKNYGGRGITICDEWRTDFSAFLAHIGNAPSPKHSIDRIDNDGNYEPGNVRWATKKEQANNTSTVRIYDYQGDRLTISQAMSKSGIRMHIATINNRLRKGWSLEDAINTPVDKKYARNIKHAAA